LGRQRDRGLAGCGAVVAADRHRQYLPGAGLDDHFGGGGPVGLFHGAVNGLLGGALYRRVKAGLDGQAAFEQPVVTLGSGGAQGLVGQQDLADVVAEERRRRAQARVGCRGRQRGCQAQRLAASRSLLPGGDVAELAHSGQHLVAAGCGGLGVAQRVVSRRSLHQPGQQRRLPQAQLPDTLSEVALGGGTDAVSVVAEEGDVQIALQDPGLGPALLERQGVASLPDLAGQRLAGRGLLLVRCRRLLEQHVLDVLLGQSGPALLGDTDLGVLQRRPGQAFVVDPVMGVEPRVLDVDDGLAHHRSDLLDADRDPVLRPVQHRDDAAVGGQDPTVHPEHRVGQTGRQRLETVRGALRK